MATVNNEVSLKIVSYNMHGFHQGYAALEDLNKTYYPDVILLQEHWLAPSNLYKFDNYFTGFFSFGCSAMMKNVETGMLRGRPFGGVMMLIKNDLRKYTETVVCDERYIIVKIGDLLIVNTYLPCCGTEGRIDISKDILLQIEYWCEHFHWCRCLVAGDFNCNLDSTDPVAQLIATLSVNYSLLRCDKLFRSDMNFTYFNQSLNHYSYIDYALVSSDVVVNDFIVIDPSINFSDHLPLFVSLMCTMKGNRNKRECKPTAPAQCYPRWDKADLGAYYRYTGDNLAPLVPQLDELISGSQCSKYKIDELYERIVSVLNHGEKLYVPRRNKQFYKFWWNEELSILKQAAVEADRQWKAAGKPHSGPVFDSRQQSRLKYRKRIRECEQESTLVYTNELHDALLRKNGVEFWKCWRANFQPVNKCVEVENIVDSDVIVGKFAAHFSSSYTHNDADKAKRLYDEYKTLRATYRGFTLTDEHSIDTELVSTVISRLHAGKAADIAGLTAEHLTHSHPSLPVVLGKLFKLIFQHGYVPEGFRQSYIVPVPKVKDCRIKSMTCNDFRGIAISPIVSKIFEYCILHKFNQFLGSCDVQFGFKKGLGCRNAIYTVRKIIDRYVEGGSTVNVCSIDLTKAFDKVNHSALYMKLMKRHVPVELLRLLESWLSDCFACVKWNNSWSCVFKVSSGVRQGSVLSPYLFAVYVDDIGKLFNARLGTFVVLYADDILLLAPSVALLQSLLQQCENELNLIDMAINTKKVQLRAYWSKK